jgi:hypothetical protein
LDQAEADIKQEDETREDSHAPKASAAIIDLFTCIGLTVHAKM